MLRNHLIFAIRLFLKDSVYSVLNILGLTLGITIGIILLLYLKSELTYDQHYTKHEQIYRFTNHLQADGADFNTSRSARELGQILKSDLPEVLEYVRFNDVYYHGLVEYQDEEGTPHQFYEDHIWQTDSNFFSVFDHTFYEGNPKTCLTGPGKVVLTKSVAERYFGKQSAMGKILEFPEERREVTAVISDLPDNTHLKYELLLSDIPVRSWIEKGDASRKSEGFWNPNCFTYLLLPPNYHPEDFYTKFPAIFEKTFGLFAQRINGRVTPNLQPLSEIHFHSTLADDEFQGSLNYVSTFAAIGLFIILLACINYMNMATARSVMRTGEMGVRKVLGFSKIALFRNVLLEAFLLAAIAAVMAIILTYIILEFTQFNQLIGKNLSLNFIETPWVLPGILGITLVVGVLSGIYPAIYIPSVPIVLALKGTFTGDRAGALFRKGLIVFQFVISIFVIICTVLMDKQIDYVQNRELGFTKDNIVLVEIQDTTVSNHMDAIKADLLQNPNILSSATSYSTPGVSWSGQVVRVERDSIMAQQHMSMIYAGTGFIETMGMELISGRNFREDSPNDYHKTFIVNESGAKELGWGENAVGKKVRYFHGEEDLHVIGVVKDFHFESLHTKINPLFIVLVEQNEGRIHIRVKGENLQATLDYIGEIWTKYDTNHPFEYRFLNEEFDKQYKADVTQKHLISILSYICIIISLLGLIGLSAFTASRKAKEISIRKVMGAKVSTIIFLFSRDYLKLILIAFFISVPIANYMIVEWLSGFAYQMPIRWYYFAIPGLIVLILGLVTVALQSLRSAQANPVDGLRRE